MKENEKRQLSSERQLASEVTGDESDAVGRALGQFPDDAMAEQYTPSAVVARQRQIIVLLNGVRALNIALVCMFVVFGICGVLLLGGLNDTKRMIERHQQEQQIVLCDIYVRLDETPPTNLGC